MGWRAAFLALLMGIGMGSAAVAQDAVGDWSGALAVGAGMKLRLVLHIAHAPGGLAASLDSIDQNAFGVPASSVSEDGGKVRIAIDKIGAVFTGALKPGGQALDGDFVQGGAHFPLALSRQAAGAAPTRLVRPQTPQKPYPYREEEVVYPGKAGVRLGGTLTLPKGSGPFPAVVLIAGSGPNARDEEVFGHKLFLVLADHLTRHGIAVLRYDKRGLGASGGDYKTATSMDFADDAESAAAYLRARPEIDPRRVGLIGHSEGGLIAPMVAARDPKIGFIVLMAGPGLRGEQILLDQQRLIAKAMGATDAMLDKAATANRKLYAAVAGAADTADATAKAKAALAGSGLPADRVDAAAQQISSPWFRFFLTYDPAPTLAKVKCPVLAVNGSKDLQVPPAEDLAAIKAALAGNRDVRIVELDGLNHLFQTATTGAPSEYAEIEETMSPKLLNLVTDWIGEHAR